MWWLLLWVQFHLPIQDRESLPSLSIPLVVLSLFSISLFISTTISLLSLSSLYPRNQFMHTFIFQMLLLLRLFNSVHCSYYQVHRFNRIRFKFDRLEFIGWWLSWTKDEVEWTMLGRFTLAIMELDCVLGRQMILVEFGFALNRITLSSLSTPQSL